MILSPSVISYPTHTPAPPLHPPPPLEIQSIEPGIQDCHVFPYMGRRRRFLGELVFRPSKYELP